MSVKVGTTKKGRVLGFGRRSTPNLIQRTPFRHVPTGARPDRAEWPVLIIIGGPRNRKHPNPFVVVRHPMTQHRTRFLSTPVVPSISKSQKECFMKFLTSVSHERGWGLWEPCSERGIEERQSSVDLSCLWHLRLPWLVGQPQTRLVEQRAQIRHDRDTPQPATACTAIEDALVLIQYTHSLLVLLFVFVFLLTVYEIYKVILIEQTVLYGLKKQWVRIKEKIIFKIYTKWAFFEKNNVLELKKMIFQDIYEMSFLWKEQC